MFLGAVTAMPLFILSALLEDTPLIKYLRIGVWILIALMVVGASFISFYLVTTKKEGGDPPL